MGGVIDTASVRILPDLSRFEAELRTQLAGAFQPVKDAGQRATDDLADSFRHASNVVDRQLREIGGPATFVPLVAEAKIAAGRVEESFEEAGEGGKRGMLRGFAGALENVGQTIATTLARITPTFGIGLAESIKGAGPQASAALAAVVLGSIATLGPAIAATIVAAVSLGLGAATIAIGAFALRNSQKLKSAFAGTGKSISDSLARAAAPLQGPFVRALNLIADLFDRLGPMFNRTFSALAPVVNRLTDAFIAFVGNALGGLERAMPGVRTAFDQLARSLPGLGKAIGDLFAQFGKPENQRAIQLGTEIITGLATAAVKVVDVLLFLGRQFGKFVDSVKVSASALAGAVRGIFGWKDATDKGAAATKTATMTVDFFAVAQRAVATTIANSKDAIDKLSGSLKEVKDKFRETVDSVKDSILAYDGLISKSKVTASKVISDLRNQVANFKTYSVDVHRLIKAGVNPAAIEELSRKGPEFIHALATGSAAQLRTYKAVWVARNSEIRGNFARTMDQQYAKLKKTIEDMQNKINELSNKTIYITVKVAAQIAAGVQGYLNAAKVQGFHQSGTMFAPGGLSILHPGEIVIPPGLSELIRQGRALFGRDSLRTPITGPADIIRRGGEMVSAPIINVNVEIHGTSAMDPERLARVMQAQAVMAARDVLNEWERDGRRGPRR